MLSSTAILFFLYPTHPLTINTHSCLFIPRTSSVSPPFPSLLIPSASSASPYFLSVFTSQSSSVSLPSQFLYASCLILSLYKLVPRLCHDHSCLSLCTSYLVYITTNHSCLSAYHPVSSMLASTDNIPDSLSVVRAHSLTHTDVLASSAHLNSLVFPVPNFSLCHNAPCPLVFN